MKNIFILSLIMFSIVTSCQKQLSREEARTMIVDNKNYPIRKNYQITKSYIKDMSTEGNGVSIVLGEDETKNEEKIIKQFESMGLLKLKETPQRRESTSFLIGTTVRTWTLVKVTLTDTGNKYLVQEKSDAYVVNLWEIDVNEITGIQEIEGQKLAKVDYTISNKNITPFGSIFSDKNNISDRSIYFSLYDDGWRIQE